MLDTFIFIPAFRCEKTLLKVLDEISIWTRARVLVIDDGSEDNTENVFKKFYEENPELQAQLEYLKFEKNCGYGAVVKRGIKEGVRSSLRYIVSLHGDNQYPAKKIPELLFELENSKAVIVQGSRRQIKNDAKKGGMPLYKRLGGTFLTLLENIVFKNKLSDRHSGFIAYKSAFLQKIDQEKLSPSFDIDLEIIAEADILGYEIREIPIPTKYEDEISYLNVFNYGFRVLCLIAKTLWRKIATPKA